MASEACCQQNLPRLPVTVTFDCFHPLPQSSIRKPHGPLPLQTTSIGNLEWASAFLDHAGHVIKTREQKYEELAKKYNSALDTLGRNKTIIQELGKENVALGQRIDHLNLDVARQEQAHRHLDVAFDNFRRRAKKEKAILTKDLNGTRQKLNAALSHDVKDHQALEDLRQALEKETKANALLQEKLDGKIKELLQTQQELQAAKDVQKVSEKEIARLHVEIEKLKQGVADRDRKLRRYDSDLALLREGNAALTVEKNQLSTNLATKTAELLKAQQELTVALGTIATQKVTISNHEEKIEDLTIQLDHQKQQNKDQITRSEKTVSELTALIKAYKMHDEEDEQAIANLKEEKDLHTAKDNRDKKSLDAAQKIAQEAMADNEIKKAAAQKDAEEARKKAIEAEAERKKAEAEKQKAELERDEAKKLVLAHQVKLANPIALVGSLKGAPRDVDDETFYINCTFPVTLFNVKSNKIYISTNGLFTLDQPSEKYDYQKFPYRGWISQVLPEHVLAPFWADLFIYKNTPQGIYYEETGSAPNRKLEVEWYVSRYNSPKQYYHFSLTVEEAKPNMTTFKYFEALDKGKNCTVGIQGPKTSSMYCYDDEKINPGLQVTFDTAKNKFTTSEFEVPAPAKKPVQQGCAVNDVKPAKKPVQQGCAVNDVKPANQVKVTVSQVVDMD